MAADRGAARELRADEIDPAWLAAATTSTSRATRSWSSRCAARRCSAVELARAAGARDQRRPRLLERDPRQRRRGRSARPFARLAPDVVFANEDEERRRRPLARSTPPGSSSAERAAARSTATSARRSPVDAGRRLDRRRRRARRGLDRRRSRPRARGGRAVRPAGRRDADSVRERERADPASPTRCARALDEGRRSSRSRRRSSRTAFPLLTASRSGSRWSTPSAKQARSPRRSACSTAAIRVGLTDDELARFDSSARKVGPRDLAACAVAGRRRRDDGRRRPRRRAHRRHPLPRHGRDRRRAPRLPDPSGRLGRPRRPRARHRVLVVVLGREVAPRHPGDDGAPRDARHPRARLRHGHAPALLLGGRRAARPAARRRRPDRGADRGGALAARAPAASSSRTRRRRASRSSELIEEAVAEAARQGVSGQARDAVRARVPPRALRRANARGQPRARRRQRTARRRGVGSVRRPVSLYDAVSDLPLAVEGYDLDVRALEVSSGFTRKTTTIRLVGARRGGARRGRHVRGDRARRAARSAGPVLPLAGDVDDRLVLGAPRRRSRSSTTAPERDVYVDYRRWAFESAALDLALRQSGTIPRRGASGARLGPLTYVVSMRLGEPPTIERARRAGSTLYPSLRFKLDATSDWTDELVARAARARLRRLRSTSRATTRGRSSTRRRSRSLPARRSRGCRASGSRTRRSTTSTRRSSSRVRDRSPGTRSSTRSTTSRRCRGRRRP